MMGFSDSEEESNSDSDYMEDDGDGTVKDKMPPHNPEVVYDKADPPMAVGSIFSDMNAFRLALATHAIRNEFEFNIQKSETRRYRAYCSGRADGCRWRIHTSTMGDKTKVKVNFALVVLFFLLL